MKRMTIFSSVLFSLFFVQTAVAQLLYSDNFDDGIINSDFWQAAGNGISESGGTLNISRDAEEDMLSSVETFSGNLEIIFDIEVENMVWQDPNHGISLATSHPNVRPSHGVTFGFERSSNKFYRVWHKGGSAQFHRTTSFRTDQIYTLGLLVESEKNRVRLKVDNQVLFTVPFFANEYRIYFPGYYTDGDGDSIYSGTTNSKIDNFRVSVPVPEPSAGVLVTGMLFLAIRRKRRGLRAG